MFGGGNMGDMMKQVKELRKAQKELKKVLITIEKNDVSVTVNGEMKITDLKIEDASDLKKISKAVKENVNEAIKKVQYESAQKLSGMTGGLNLPGMG